MSSCGVYLSSSLTGYSERFFKKLAGNREMEDSLEKLDKLTQEEARMASAEQLRITHSAHRPLSFQIFILLTQTASQGTSLEIISYDGFRPQIHHQIITLHPKPIMKARLDGFSKGLYSIIGSLLAPSCGYTENVRYSWPLSCDDPLMMTIPRFYSRFRKNHRLVRCFFFNSYRLFGTDIMNSVPQLFKILWRCAIMGRHRWPTSTSTSGTSINRTSATSFRLFLSNSLHNPIPVVMCSPDSIPHTIVG